MDSGSSPSLFPLHRCKTIHLVRHGQGIHNVEGAKNYKKLMKPEYFDAHLTPLGWQQVDNLRKHVHESGLSKRIELVITSPLLRALQTAVGVFGGEGYTDRTDILPLMVANAGYSEHPSISSLNCPPIIAIELCREHLGVHPCDNRRSISDYQFLFPAVDFSLIESDEDILWKANVRELKEEVAARGLKFLNWLSTRKEKEIAIVTHGGFLFHTLSALLNDCDPLAKKEMCKHFANCELRSMVIVDRRMTGSDSSTTNYPGKIPDGLDLPSDVAGENLEKEKSNLV
ncbi:PREDICTED: phosphoglycerate mutase-like protein 1 [Prunus mume]|uniref:Phosphoglycerate mutase-like protein 1 n=1 Tax=Prunus mume TaxID=102107 RepID=A0ABM1LT21_PRUMU|nr:PREDICTED: phosphoglycerate mutase-like protein 1 [Prunus mume]XP_008237056.1 PREDICTED: phosphoglycerate mutase-like protein 1 [Prunus mume]XP_016650548.1 PREDICTED: phosphoglycerate mutase-like protein 1 [Prunus mume]